MQLQKENNPTCSTLELTKELAQQIYTDSNEYSSASKMFNDGCGHDWSNVKKVFELAEQCVKEINRYMSGQVVTKEAVYDEETGELVSPVEYYTPTTKTDLVKQLECELLDCSIILDDYMNNKTWEEFKAGYSQGE